MAGDMQSPPLQPAASKPAVAVPNSPGFRTRRFPRLRRASSLEPERDWIGMLPPGRQMLRAMRAVRRLLCVLVLTAIAVPAQTVAILLPGSAKRAVPVIFWRSLCVSIGLAVRVLGEPAQVAGRPVVYVANHSSWLDILVIGSRLRTCFVAKEEVGRWPVIATVARLGRSVFVRRRRASTVRECNQMASRLVHGDNLVLFPEGTTSDGSRVLAFRSAFLAIAGQRLPNGQLPLVQPVSIAYDRLAGLPTGRFNRPLFAWYGAMEIGPHFWALAKHCGLRATVMLHPPLDPAVFASRKELTAAVWQAVAEGAACLRQNRLPSPASLHTAASLHMTDSHTRNT